MSILVRVAAAGTAVLTPSCTPAADHLHNTTAGGIAIQQMVLAATSNDSAAATEWEAVFLSQDANWDGLSAITQPTVEPTAGVTTVSASWGSPIALGSVLGFAGSAFAPTTPQRYLFWARVTKPIIGLWGGLATGGVYVGGVTATAYQPDGGTEIPLA